MLEIGLKFDGKYKIIRLLGEGGMGAVYEGLHTLINRRVAIKILHPNLTKSDELVQRFQAEARAAGSIGNDHILEVLDLGELPSGECYMVLEYLDGESFADRLKREKTLTEHQLYPLLRQALSGLAAAHRAEIIHRDIKPDNLFILKQKAGLRDFVKIIDFGVSKFSKKPGELALTTTGAVIGTPYYMSPEQAKGVGGITHQSDLYSMGVIAFQMLTGRLPFDGASFNDLMFKIVLNEVEELTELLPELDPAFAAIVHRAMSKSTSERYPTADDFIAALDEWAPDALSTAPPPARGSTVSPSRKAVASSDNAVVMSPETFIADVSAENEEAPPPIEQSAAEGKMRKLRTDTSWANTHGDASAVDDAPLSQSKASAGRRGIVHKPVVWVVGTLMIAAFGLAFVMLPEPPSPSGVQLDEPTQILQPEVESDAEFAPHANKEEPPVPLLPGSDNRDPPNALPRSSPEQKITKRTSPHVDKTEPQRKRASAQAQAPVRATSGSPKRKTKTKMTAPIVPATPSIQPKRARLPVSDFNY